MDQGRLVSLNVGGLRRVDWNGREVTTGIWKAPVDHPVALAGTQLDGDVQADLRVHGGEHKAVYAYATEDYEWWRGQQLDRDGFDAELRPGTFGENLTTAGIDVTGAVIGERWSVGSAVLEVSEPRFACFKLGIRMGGAAFSPRFDDALRPGAYLRIVRAGTVEAGDEIRIADRPAHGLTIRDVADAETNHVPALLARMVDVADLSDARRHAAARALDRIERAG
jgi:MOSC domain-containing protein YiiM